jgi:hypothetical protein
MAINCQVASPLSLSGGMIYPANKKYNIMLLDCYFKTLSLLKSSTTEALKFLQRIQKTDKQTYRNTKTLLPDQLCNHTKRRLLVFNLSKKLSNNQKNERDNNKNNRKTSQTSKRLPENNIPISYSY